MVVPNGNNTYRIASLIMSLVATGAAVWGLRQWKKQMEFNTRFEWARRFVLLAFEFQQTLMAAQSPFGYEEEYAGRPKGENETAHQASMLNQRHAHLKRIQPFLSILRQMQTLDWEAKSLFGEDAEKYTKYIATYHDIYAEMRLAILMVFNPRNDGMYSKVSITPDEIAKADKYQGMVWGNGAGVELREREAENTRKITEELSKYTFSKPAKRNKTVTEKTRKLEERSNQLEKQLSESQKQYKEVADKLSAALQRLADVENDDSADEFDFHTQEDTNNQA
jgi:hypothetical protein